MIAHIKDVLYNECEWLKNELNYFVSCKYFRLILQPLQTVTNGANYSRMHQVKFFRGLHHVVVVIATVQLHSTKPELRFCAGSDPARGVSEIRDAEDL